MMKQPFLQREAGDKEDARQDRRFIPAKGKTDIYQCGDHGDADAAVSPEGILLISRTEGYLCPERKELPEHAGAQHSTVQRSGRQAALEH